MMQHNRGEKTGVHVLHPNELQCAHTHQIRIHEQIEVHPSKLQK
jgi:hypothetical protein